MKKVAVLGLGPAGLIAAQAAALTGSFVSLFSQGDEHGPVKSRIGGAQFLHRPIPGINAQSPDGEIKYKLTGSPIGYRNKVYGDGSVPFVSAENITDGMIVPAWSLLRTYDALWEQLVSGVRVNTAVITPYFLVELIESKVYDLIISTIPRTALCLSRAGLINGTCQFSAQTIRVANHSAFDLPEGTVLYDGTGNVSWYRTANIFGHGSTEWGAGAPQRLPYDELATISKPIATTCSCFSTDVLFAGRYGEWRKGVLAHEAFDSVRKVLS